VSNRSLRTIRNGVPEHRDEPALAPYPAPHWATTRDGSAYVHISVFPRTIDELRKLSRDYGDAAVAETHWGCVLTWLMHEPHETDLSNPCRVAMVATHMVHEHDRIRLGWPRHDGYPWNPPALDYLSPDVREEAERVAAETLSDWEKAGKPYMGGTKIKRTYLALVSCPDFSRRYVRPINDNEEQNEPDC